MGQERGHILSVSVWEREKTALDTLTEVRDRVRVRARVACPCGSARRPHWRP